MSKREVVHGGDLARGSSLTGAVSGRPRPGRGAASSPSRASVKSSDGDRAAPGRRRHAPPQAPVVERLACPARHAGGAAEADPAAAAVELRVLAGHERPVALGAEEPEPSRRSEGALAQRRELRRVVLDVVVGVDDLVGRREGQPVGGDEHGRAARAQRPARPRPARARGRARARSSGPAIRRRTRRRERQLAHVGDHGLARPGRASASASMSTPMVSRGAAAS